MVLVRPARSRFGPESRESAAARALGDHLGTRLQACLVTVDDHTAVEVAGMATDGRTVVQYVLNEGAAGSAERNRVAADLLKLVWVRGVLGGDVRAALCVSPGVAAVLAPRGWLSAAARDLGVAVFVVAADGTVRQLGG